MKKVIVVSFQRSGTHFLINTLSSNFEQIEDGWVDVIHGKDNKWVSNVHRGNLRDKIREQLLDKYLRSQVNKCVKTHYQAYFFEAALKKLSKRYAIFYIIRDPRDVMVACYNYYNNTNYERFIKETNFSVFLRKDLRNVRTETNPFSFSHVKPRNVIDKWHNHVLSWLPYRNKEVTFIHFEELRNDLKSTIGRIADVTGFSPRAEIHPVTVDDCRYRPDFISSGLERGAIGIWRKYFTKEDMDFLNGIISPEVSEVAYFSNRT